MQTTLEECAKLLNEAVALLSDKEAVPQYLIEGAIKFSRLLEFSEGEDVQPQKIARTE